MMANMANMIYPIMPDTANSIKKMLGLDNCIWHEQQISGDIKINDLVLLFERIDEKK